MVDTIVSTGEAEYERHLIREHAVARAAGKVCHLVLTSAFVVSVSDAIA